MRVGNVACNVFLGPNPRAMGTPSGAATGMRAAAAAATAAATEAD